jgi:hypothetical protein
MPFSEQQEQTLKAIAARLLSLESASPGIVRMRATSNPVLREEALERLTAIGMKKGFFQNPDQFIYDSFLSNQTAAEVLLRKTMLAGAEGDDGYTPLWSPWGQFIGAGGHLQVHDFSDQKWNRIWLIILIEPFFDSLTDILAPPK